jgi:hypothetical protein
MRIFSVTEVTVTKISESPLVLSIAASGLASSTGWTHPRLDGSGDPNPGDQVFEFSFEADRPGGISLPVLTPIHAQGEARPPAGADAVIVHARTNSITVHASEFLSPAPATTRPLAEEATTMMMGEEGGTTTTARFGEEIATTFRVGEEDIATTFVVGEETGSTSFRGEEDPPPTTARFGEEIHTTLRVGEEGDLTTFRFEEGSTMRFGEEGPTTDPRLDDPVGPAGGGFDPFGGF